MSNRYQNDPNNNGNVVNGWCSQDVVFNNEWVQNELVQNITGINIWGVNGNFINLTGSSINLNNLTVTNETVSNLTGSNINAVNLKSTNFTGVNNTLTNANITNLNSITQTGTNSYIQNITSNNLTSTGIYYNIISGNNAYENNLSILNITGINSSFINADITNISSSLITATNNFLTNINSSVITGTNAIFQNLYFVTSTGQTDYFTGSISTYIIGTIITGNQIGATGMNVYIMTGQNLFITNETCTNLTGINNQLVNINSSNISGTNTIFTNSTITNANISLLTGTNNKLVNINSSSISGTNNQLVNINSSSISGTNNQLTNITSSNISGTNTIFTNSTITNLNATLISGTNIFLSNLKFNLETGTNAYITNVNFNSMTGNILQLGMLNIASGCQLFGGLTADDIDATVITGTNNNLTYINCNTITGVNGIFNNLTFTGATVYDLNCSVFTGTNNFLTNIKFSNETGTNSFITNITNTTFTGSTAFITNITNTNLTFNNATGQSLQLFQPGTQNTFNSNQFYQTVVGNNLALGTTTSLTGGNQNLAIGQGSLLAISQNVGASTANIAIGLNAGIHFITGSNNVFLGVSAGANVGQGSFNVFIGQNDVGGAASVDVNSNSNVVIGAAAAQTITGACSNNVYIGENVLIGSTISGSQNTIIGSLTTTPAGVGTVSNSIGLGYQSQVGQSNVAVIGNNAITNILPGTGSTCDLGISYQPFNNFFVNNITATNITGTTIGYTNATFTNLTTTTFTGTTINIGNLLTSNIASTFNGNDGGSFPIRLFVPHTGTELFMGYDQKYDCGVIFAVEDSTLGKPVVVGPIVKTGQSNSTRNVLDDGSGNITMNSQSSGNLTINSNGSKLLRMITPITGNSCYTEYNNSNSGRSAYIGLDGFGLLGLETGAMMLSTDSTANKPIYLSPGLSTNWGLKVSSGKVVNTANNTLDDGSGNLYGGADNTFLSWDDNANRVGIAKKSGFTSLFSSVGTNDMTFSNFSSLNNLSSTGISGYIPTTVFNIGHSGIITTKNNTLDDGSGNMTINGSLHNVLSMKTSQTDYIETDYYVNSAFQGKSGFSKTAGLGYFVQDSAGNNIIKQNGDGTTKSLLSNNNTLDDGNGQMTIVVPTGDQPLTMNTTSTSANGGIILNLNGTSKMQVKYDTTNGIQINDIKNSCAWLYQGSTATGNVRTLNNILDDGHGYLTINGADTSQYPLTANCTNVNGTFLRVRESGIDKCGFGYGSNGCEIYDINNSSTWLNQGGTTKGNVQTLNNTLDDGRGQASFKDVVSISSDTKTGGGVVLYLNQTGTTAGSYLQFSLRGKPALNIGYETGGFGGVVFYDAVNNSEWLTQKGNVSGNIQTLNNTLDNGTGGMTVNGSWTCQHYLTTSQSTATATWTGSGQTVVCNGNSGYVSLNSFAIGSGVTQTIVVSNNYVGTNNIILLTGFYAQTTSLIPWLKSQSNGSFSVYVQNLSNSTYNANWGFNFLCV
jgi:trimeric autotransporter adhesin